MIRQWELTLENDRAKVSVWRDTDRTGAGLDRFLYYCETCNKHGQTWEDKDFALVGALSHIMYSDEHKENHHG